MKRVSASTLRIGRWTPVSLVDFPGRVASALFLQGCPWRCPHCDNARLRTYNADRPVAWEDVEAWLESSRDSVEGVVFRGGEPTMQAGLIDALERCRAMGFETALHTAGIFPRRLSALLPLVDWVGFDMKAPPDLRMDRITGQAGAVALWLKSFAMLKKSGVPYTVRTTLDPAVLSESDIADLQRWLRENGGPEAVLQPARQPDIIGCGG